MKKVGLALGGGGARGIAHIVYLQVLDDLGIRPSIISGTSIGAIMGAFYAAGISGEEIEKIIRHIKLMQIGKMLDLAFFKSTGLVKGENIAKFFESSIPCQTFEELSVPLKVVASDFWTREQIIIDSGELIPAVRASMSIPGVFTPVQKEGRVLIDGGVVNPVPFDIIRDQCDVLIAIDVNSRRFPKSSSQLMPGMMESIMEAFDSFQATITQEKLKNTKVDLFLNPGLINIGILDFHHAQNILDSARKEKEPFRRKIEKILKKRL